MSGPEDVEWKRPLSLSLAGAGLLAILVATLLPTPSTVSGAFAWCVPCGPAYTSPPARDTIAFASSNRRAQ